MDVDGPQNDKGMYTIVPIKPRISINDEDVFSWNSFPGKTEGHRTIGFMAQISPDGRFAATTLNESMYVVNFKDYRFLQVFYPTRGIIAWYDRATRNIKALPGADNPYFVQTDAVWSPDGSTLVFARAPAKDPYPEGRKLAEYAGDPNELPIQYDLYRIPFRSGKGGRPMPISGASHNGMSNTFPKVSPDGRWIVFVQCRNGQLMRPDSQLYIVPSSGGVARRMRCNTPLMNSWHSFSPNGRWMVFTSKSRSPYTEMFLTHLDGNGRDSPAIRIENATAANRAVNLPEFINIAPDGLSGIEVPAAEFYRLIDSAWALAEKGELQASAAEWRKALLLRPEDAKAHNNLGRVLAACGDLEQAAKHWDRALRADPGFIEARNNLGAAMVRKGKYEQAVAQFRSILETNPQSAEVHNNLGQALEGLGNLDGAISEWRKAVALNPAYADARNNLGAGLFRKGRSDEAVAQWQAAVGANPKFAEAYFNLGRAMALKGNTDEAIGYWLKAVEFRPDFGPALVELGRALYQRGNEPAAIFRWRQALRIDPKDQAALRLLAWALATSTDAAVRNGAEAVTLAEQAVQLSGGGEPGSLDALGAAYAESGRFPEAIQAAHQAHAHASRLNQQALAAAIKKRIGLYEAGAPFRDDGKSVSQAR